MPLRGVKNVLNETKALIGRKEKKLRRAYVDTFGDIITETPIDTGRLQGNWFLTVGAPSALVTDNTNASQDDKRVPKQIFGKKIFFTNNLPYIIPLEYGGYTKNPKRGTYLGKGKGYEIRSAGGYSKQTPGGWVRGAIKRLQRKVVKI